jgi:hypothetical protein
VVEARRHQRRTQATPVGARVGRDDPDLTQWWIAGRHHLRIVRRVHTGPAEAVDAAVRSVVHEDPLGVDPALRQGVAQFRAAPTALVGVPVEGCVVHLEKTFDVTGGIECAHLDRCDRAPGGLVEGNRPAQ